MILKFLDNGILFSPNPSFLTKSNKSNERVYRAGKARAIGDEIYCINWRICHGNSEFPIIKSNVSFTSHPVWLFMYRPAKCFYGSKTVKLSANFKQWTKNRQNWDNEKSSTSCLQKPQKHVLIVAGCFAALSRLTVLSFKYSLLNPAY